MPITLRRIRSFIAVAEVGGFGRAANELNLSQPALSAHIAELEAQLGVALFRRTTRQVRLTAVGERFLDRVKRTIADLETMVLEISEEAAIQRGRVTVAAVPSIAARLLPRILSRFAQDHRGITVQICDDRAEVIERKVERSEVDFAIGPALERQTDLEFERIVDDPFLAIFPKTHRLARKRSVCLAQLIEFPLIAMRPGINMRSIMEHAFAQSDLVLRPAHEVNHHDTLTGMVEAGLGVGAMPALTISIVRQPGLAMVPIVEPTVVRQIGIIKRRGEPLSAAARLFADATREHLSSLAEASSFAGAGDKARAKRQRRR